MNMGNKRRLDSHLWIRIINKCHDWLIIRFSKIGLYNHSLYTLYIFNIDGDIKQLNTSWFYFIS